VISAAAPDDLDTIAWADAWSWRRCPGVRSCALHTITGVRRPAALRAQAPQELEAVEIRHHEVEDDGLRGHPLRRPKRRPRGDVAHGAIAELLEARLGEPEVLTVVVDDEDGGAGARLPLRGSKTRPRRPVLRSR
jgi:hypothetical protein